MAPEIAAAVGATVPYMRKILGILANAEILASVRGTRGGFSLARPASEITLRDVVSAVDGCFALNICTTPERCPRQPECPVSHVWAEAQRAVDDVLSRYTLADIARSERLRSRAGC